MTALSGMIVNTLFIEVPFQMVLIAPHSWVSDKASVIYSENYQSESQLPVKYCWIFSVLPAYGKVPENSVFHFLF
jgi:hypothetical protein